MLFKSIVVKMYKTSYLNSVNEVETEEKQISEMLSVFSPTDCTTLSFNSKNSPYQIKFDKSNEINMISAGVVRNLRMFFSQTSSALSTGTITTPKRKISSLEKKKSYEHFSDLKKSQSAQFEQMNEKVKLHQIEKTRSNNFLNEIDNKEDFVGQVNIQARINQFTRRNSLVKESKNCLRRKNSNSKKLIFSKFERDEYKGSLNYLDKIEDKNENNNYQNMSYDDSSVATTFSDDYMFDDFSSSISKKDSSLCLSLNENEVNATKVNQLKIFDKSKFEQNLSSIVTLLNELKKENEVLENFFNDLHNKIQSTSVEIKKNYEDILNWIDDETYKKTIERGNLTRMSNKNKL